MAIKGFADLSLVEGCQTVTPETSTSRKGASGERRREGNARLVGDVDQPRNLAKSVTVD